MSRLLQIEVEGKKEEVEESGKVSKIGKVKTNRSAIMVMVL